MTAGPEQALRELQRIAAVRPGAVTVGHTSALGTSLWVDVGIDCRGFPRSDEGIPLRQREWFKVSIPAEFPFRYPSVWVRHGRWADFPHVQWKRYLCLYAAPGIEWNPSDGMYGFVARLIDWLKEAALDQLDPVGGPLHRPVAYPTAGTPMIVARADTPRFEGPWWVGLAELTEVGPTRFDLDAWHELDHEAEGDLTYGVGLLLEQPLPFEFPKKLGDLIRELVTGGVSEIAVHLSIGLAATLATKQEHAYLMIGSRNRGIRGGELTQHLTAWRIGRERGRSFTLGVPRERDSPDLAKARAELAALMDKWADHADAEYCTLRESRPEVTRDRAEGSPLQWFRGRRVAIWGCGALGSHVAEALIRSGVSSLRLRDSATVGPGVLARQCYDDADIGEHKATALAARLRRLAPGVDVSGIATDVLVDKDLDADWTDDADLVIEATASVAVLKRLERLRSDSGHLAPVLSLVVGHDARRSLVTYSPEGSPAGPSDVTRKAKIAAAERSDLTEFADEFWPATPRTPSFQPEPGCSEPTFTGSDVEVSAMTALMLLAGTAELAAASEAPTATFASLSDPIAGIAGHSERVAFAEDQVVEDQNELGFSIRIPESAARKLEHAIRKSERAQPGAETGGLLFGEIDRAVGVVWVTDVIGPPADSHASPLGFVCGTKGVDRTAAALARKRRGASRPVGMWHTHPEGPSRPSPTDHGGMHQLVTDADRPLPQQLLLIIGGSSERRTFGAYMFDQDRPVIVVPTPSVIKSGRRPRARVGRRKRR